VDNIRQKKMSLDFSKRKGVTASMDRIDYSTLVDHARFLETPHQWDLHLRQSWRNAHKNEDGYMQHNEQLCQQCTPEGCPRDKAESLCIELCRYI